MLAVLEQAAAIFLALLFALASEHKLRAPRPFAARLREYALLPSQLALILAWGLGLAEAVLALALALRIAPAFAAAALLLMVYLAAMAVQLARGRRDLDCGCIAAAASGAQQLHPWLLARNAGLIALALFAHPESTARADGAGLLLGLAAGASLFLLALTAQQLFLNFEQLGSSGARRP